MPGDFEQPDPLKPPEPTGEEAMQDADDVDIGSYQQDDPNLVHFFAQSEKGREFLSKIAKQVTEDFDTDWENSAEYRERRRSNFRMLTGARRKKEKPFEGCANAHTPLMLERALRLAANVYVEIYTDRDTVFAVKPTGPDDYELAELLTIHGNWQIQNEITDFYRQQQRAIQEFFMTGSVFCHSWYDPIARRNRHDIMNCDEFVIPYVWTTVTTDMSDVPRKTRILRKYRHELEDMRDTDNEYERWENVDDVLAKDPPQWDTDPEGVAREEGARYEGIRAPEKSKNAPYILLEQHGFARMPGGKKQRPICALVDKTSKAVLKLYIREEEDWRDRARFDQHQSELEQFHQDSQDHADLQMQSQQLHARMQQPDVHPEEGAMVQHALEQEPLVPPQPPHWMKPDVPPEMQQPEPIRRVPVEQFSHGVCFENPFGSLGLSFGTVLAELNKLADESYNRLYDSATLGNVWSLLVPEGMDFGATKVPFGPGKIIRVKNTSGDFDKQIKELKPAPGNPQLMDIVKFAHENADSSVGAPGVLSGEPGKSGETFRGISTRVEKATRQLSNAGIKYLDFVGNILRNNARLNSLFMPDEEVISVLNHYADQRKYSTDPATGKPLPEIRISRDMYRRNYSVTFTADIRFSSQQQRVSEADEIIGMITSMPPLQANGALIHAAVAKAFRARGQHDLIPLLGPPPPVPTTPLGAPPPPPPGMPPGGGAPPGGPPPDGGPPQGGPPPDGIQRPPNAPGPIQGPRPEGQA